jgi:hypothetical protein
MCMSQVPPLLILLFCEFYLLSPLWHRQAEQHEKVVEDLRVEAALGSILGTIRGLRRHADLQAQDTQDKFRPRPDLYVHPIIVDIIS